MKTIQTGAAHGQLGISIDGIVGPNTESAVEGFQSANGLAVDGIVRLSTRKVLVD